MIILKSPEDLEIMREAGRIVARVLAQLARAARPGVATGQLDALAEEIIRSAGAEPSFKGYRGFPASICTSVNEQVVHGIPGARKLSRGDVLSIDVGVFYRGFHGDAAISLPIGMVAARGRRLLEVAEESLARAVAVVRPGGYVSDIGHAVQSYVESQGFAVVRDLVGHGIGQKMHESPQVPNFGTPGNGALLRPGMTLAIEPMVNSGGHQVRTLADGWTVVTADRSLSAHFEHTVAVTETGADVLTMEA
ncbi:MAG TPA: type I methionyl aminopeptidase [Clostridiales bacterium UBA8153]|nr:type I methionyl aminopeptidase [Clostridiales bacterium UBA8153]